MADGEIVDQYVAAALSDLDLEQFAATVTHLGHRSATRRGADASGEGEPAEKFYIVTSGEAEVVLEHPGRPEDCRRAAQRRPVLRRDRAHPRRTRTATVRAAPDGDGLEVMALDRETFHGITDQSDLTREEIERAIGRRLGELAAAPQSSASPSAARRRRD